MIGALAAESVVGVTDVEIVPVVVIVPPVAWQPVAMEVTVPLPPPPPPEICSALAGKLASKAASSHAHFIALPLRTYSPHLRSS